jgi:YD repeat-containing protein
MDDKILNYSSSGILRTIVTKGGSTLVSYTYSGPIPSLPSRVSNTAGHYVDFTYNAAGMVSQAKDQDGNAWIYQYNTPGMLISVVAPSGAPDVRTYFYETPNIDPKLLTGIAINGARYSNYTYYSDKRVQASGLVGEEERDTFIYGASTTTVTDAKGQSTLYSRPCKAAAARINARFLG